MSLQALMVEDDADRAAWIARETPKVKWRRAPNEKIALGFLRQALAARQALPPVVFLDFDLHGVHGGGGEKVADWLCRHRYPGVVVVQSTNPVGGPRMTQDLAACGIRVLHAPAFSFLTPGPIWRHAFAIAGQR